MGRSESRGTWRYRLQETLTGSVARNSDVGCRVCVRTLATRTTAAAAAANHYASLCMNIPTAPPSVPRTPSTTTFS